MNNKIKTVFVAVIAITTTLLAGCATSGNQVLANDSSASLANQLTAGRTTEADVRNTFGRPDSTSVDSTGDTVWTYSSHTMSGKSFIPGYSALPSSTIGHSKQLSVYFNDRGVLKHYDLANIPLHGKLF